MRYEFATANRIIVGPGSSAELPGLIRELGRWALLVQRRNLAANSPAAELIKNLEDSGFIATSWMVSGEPEIATVEKAADLARNEGCDLVIGIGGGSVIDSAKAIAALATNDGGALDYMEIVGAGKALTHPALPMVAVPTTAGTGSEVTRNAVLTVPLAGVKASMRDVSLLPRLALVDSTLTHDMPPAVTASCGMDALTQLLEAFVSRRAQPLTDGLCIDGLRLVAKSLRPAYYQPGDAVAREGMSTASLMSGMALANAGLGAVHGIAAPLGGAYRAPHGAVCAALLPTVTTINIQALRRHDLDHPTLLRYTRAAEILLGRPGATPDDLVAWLRELVEELHIAPLGAYGINPTRVPELADQAARASSTRANPIDLEAVELAEAIRQAL